ncbi:sulfotransferase domain-containing protein [Pikeienuella sp. HZG-20]|uniref:sulfotransferase domain-containing protein n=1 Tax=Paludibacillus litoralis TaxID=3133267 RepID=UPI0030ED4E17
MKKLFLCVGAAKSGTTWLYQNIRANPGLWFTPEKELHYHFSIHGRFDRLTPEIREGKLERYRKWMAEPGRKASRMEERLEWYRRFAAGPVDDAWYRSLFDGMPEDAWACDFSPSTALLPDAGWASVAAFAPEIRIVYILREPEERLWSHAKFHAAFINQLDAFKAMKPAEMQRFINRFSLTEDGDYGDHLRRILAHIPRENVLLLEYAEISKAPVNALRRVEAHLGLGPTPERDGKLEERINVSEKMPKPRGFGRSHRARFRREMKLLVEQGVEFARPWAELHSPGPARWRRLLAEALER